jgi:NADPH:quinone reductase-like Zn-dependent oxidoreductase
MKQLVNTAHGSYDVLELQEVPDLIPDGNELLIQVKAAGLNFADILARKGQYPDAPSKPCVMGYEVSGIVIAAGPNADSSRIGEEVLAMCKFKGQAEQVVVPQNLVYKKPEKLSFEEAAALPVTYLTAWMLLHVMGGLKAEESILIHNAGGGVGLAQIDIANHIGATIYGTASARKHDFLKEKGVHHCIDYRNNDWLTELKKLTDDRGVELITDPLGGKEWKQSYQALRSTGRLGMFGVSTASDGDKGGLKGTVNLLKAVVGMPLFHPLSLMSNNKATFGVNLGHMWHEADKAKQWMTDLLKGVEEGWIKPHVDCSFPLARTADAHRYLEERKNIGKVVLVCN